MSKYVKSIVRDGNNMVVTYDDCTEEIIPVCCEDSEPPIEDENPEETVPPPMLGNAKCITAVYLDNLVENAWAEFLIAVDPVLAGLPPYQVPFVAQYVYDKGWPTSMIAPLIALLSTWAFTGRYTGIRIAADNFPDVQPVEDFREVAYCILPSDAGFSNAVRNAIADAIKAKITDPERSVGEFMLLMPIGWLQRELQLAINTVSDPDVFDCSEFDCADGGGEGCLTEYLWDYAVEPDTGAWLSLAGHSTSEFPGLPAAMGGVAKTIQASRINSPPDRWRGEDVGNGVNAPVGVWYSFPEACRIERVRARGGTGTQNSQNARIYYKLVGDVEWRLLAETVSPLNNKSNPGGTWPIVEYGKPGDNLPAIPNVIALAFIWQAGGFQNQISWLSINYYGAFPALP